jgi:hypothetical protein
MAMTDVCRFVRWWIAGLRRDMCVAISIDELLEQMNGFLRDVGYGKLEAVTESELKECLKHINTVEIIIKDGKEVVWLWGGRLRRRLFNKIVEKAAEDGEVVVA